MKYFTGRGDKGETSLCSGQMVGKDSTRIAAFGDVDELNTHIGFARLTCKDRDICGNLERVQNELFILGADLSTPLGTGTDVPRITAKHVKFMETQTEKIGGETGNLKHFILPGGTETAVRLQMARAVCRRAERAIVALHRKERINSQNVPYINRLSSLLFALARLANERAKIRELEWKK